MLRVALHLKPESPASTAAPIAGTGLDSGRGLSSCSCQTPWRVLAHRGRPLSLLTGQRQEEFPRLWVTGVPDPLGIGVPNVVNTFIFTGVSEKTWRQCSGPEIAGLEDKPEALVLPWEGQLTGSELQPHTPTRPQQEGLNFPLTQPLG